MILWALVVVSLSANKPEAKIVNWYQTKAECQANRNFGYGMQMATGDDSKDICLASPDVDVVPRGGEVAGCKPCLSDHCHDPFACELRLPEDPDVEVVPKKPRSVLQGCIDTPGGCVSVGGLLSKQILVCKPESTTRLICTPADEAKPSH